MEERGYIEIKIEGKVGNKTLSPDDLDISEIKEMISDVETFLYPTRSEKAARPQISYKLEQGSAKHLFFLPISGVLLFNGLTGEIVSRGNTYFLEYKRAEVISKFQKLAKEKDYQVILSCSASEPKELIISKYTDFYNVVADFIETELLLYGKINSEGGNDPNFHIKTKEYGTLTVEATELQLLEGEKRLYKIYGVKVKGKQSLVDGKPFDLKLIDYLDEYKPIFDESELDILINRASKAWDTVEDVDAWLSNIRGGTNE